MNLIDLPDDQVDEKLDKEIMKHLQICFENDFLTQRFWREPPKHRFFLRDPNANNKLIGHCAIHMKDLTVIDSFQHSFSQSGVYHLKTAGLCEVSINPDYRKRGFVKLLLDYLETWLIVHASEFPFDFITLFGNFEYYSSSGFKGVPNKISLIDFDSKKSIIQEKHKFQYKPISATTTIQWPLNASLVDLNGYEF
jgi:predicted acetyltransferase